MLARAFLAVTAAALCAFGCGNKGQVTFVIHDADDQRLRADPLLVSEYSIKSGDGTLVGIASVNPSSPGVLALGPLMATTTPRDLVVSVLSGSELLEMARVRNVAIQPGLEVSYTAEVRKPLVFVGSAVPTEPGGTALSGVTQVLDGNLDLAHPPASTILKPLVIADVTAGAVTSDGRFFVGGQAGGITVFDTGKGVSAGDLPLPFTPTRIVTSARDVAVAALGRTGADTAVAIITDVATLGANPSAAAIAGMGTLRGAHARTAAFAPDGTRLYVLVGNSDAIDPCDGIPPPTNAISVLGLDGREQRSWTLPAFAADLAVDPATGNVIVSLPSQNKVATIDPSSPAGAVSPVSLFPATCPAALAITGGQVLVATGGQDPAAGPGTFDLLRFPAAGGSGPPTRIAVPSTTFEQPDGSPGANFNQVIRVMTKNLAGYEMAVTPDGNRAVFGARAHYLVTNGDLGFANCQITFDVVEYGLYDVDLRTGAAGYERRSLLKNGTCETHSCQDLFGATLTAVACSGLMRGDRVAGVAAVFGGP